MKQCPSCNYQAQVDLCPYRKDNLREEDAKSLGACPAGQKMEDIGSTY